MCKIGGPEQSQLGLKMGQHLFFGAGVCGADFVFARGTFALWLCEVQNLGKPENKHAMTTLENILVKAFHVESDETHEDA